MANKVVVHPGGQVFTTIQAAIDSITGASEKAWYQVVAGPGTYNENITLKEYVSLVGQDESVDNTIITSPTGAGPTVTGASNSGITACTIICDPGATWNDLVAVQAGDVQGFRITGCQIYTKCEPQKAGAVVTVNLTGSSSADNPATVNIASCVIRNTCENTGSTQAIDTSGHLTLNIYETNISTVLGSGNAWALLVEGGPNVICQDSELSCPSGGEYAYAAQISPEPGTITLVDCQTSGKVGPNVKVINNQGD